MSHTPHSLAEAFPQKIDAMRVLRARDAHFARLSEEYEMVNQRIHRAETNIEPTDDFHMEEMRKLRLKLLDEMAGMLRASE